MIVVESGLIAESDVTGKSLEYQKNSQRIVELVPSLSLNVSVTRRAELFITAKA